MVKTLIPLTQSVQQQVEEGSYTTKQTWEHKTTLAISLASH